MTTSMTGMLYRASGGDLVHIHTEAAVSGDVDDGLLRAAHFGSDGCAQAVTHGAQAPEVRS